MKFLFLYRLVLSKVEQESWMQICCAIISKGGGEFLSRFQLMSEIVWLMVLM